jgi:polyisoprenyl-phosphate glycosyltransferase
VFQRRGVIGATIARPAGHLRDLAQAGTIDPQSFVLFVDDGSSDDTWRLIADGHARDSSVKGLKLSRNFGQPAGLGGWPQLVRGSMGRLSAPVLAPARD